MKSSLSKEEDGLFPYGESGQQSFDVQASLIALAIAMSSAYKGIQGCNNPSSMEKMNWR